MRSEKEIMDLILNIAREDERIRAVYMGGSRTNPNVEKDIYQDYDIVYVVTETKSFLEDKNWISMFGDIAIVQEPDLIDVAFGKKGDFSRSYTWLMLFKDGNRIDLGIKIKEEALQQYNNDKLNLKLLDKDNIILNLSNPTDIDYWIKKPTEAEFKGCCNEFWWCLNNVAKGIARDELPYAMWMFNVPVRNMLVKMIEWHIGVNTKFSLSAGKMGKYFKKYLSDDLYEMYAKTYCNRDYHNFWIPVFKSCELFRIVADNVSSKLGYKYNQMEDKNMTEYLIKVKNNTLE